jgi:hypothetical protein
MVDTLVEVEIPLFSALVTVTSVPNLNWERLETLAFGSYSGWISPVIR